MGLTAGNVLQSIGDGIQSSHNPITGKGGATQSIFNASTGLMMAPFQLMSGVLNNPMDMMMLVGGGALVLVLLLKK